VNGEVAVSTTPGGCVGNTSVYGHDVMIPEAIAKILVEFRGKSCDRLNGAMLISVLRYAACRASTVAMVCEACCKATELSVSAAPSYADVPVFSSARDVVKYCSTVLILPKLYVHGGTGVPPNC